MSVPMGPIFGRHTETLKSVTLLDPTPDVRKRSRFPCQQMSKEYLVLSTPPRPCVSVTRTFIYTSRVRSVIYHIVFRSGKCIPGDPDPVRNLVRTMDGLSISLLSNRRTHSPYTYRVLEGGSFVQPERSSGGP